MCTYGGLIEYDKKNGFKKLDIQPNFELVIANSNMIHSTDEVVSKVKKYKEENETFVSMCNKEEKLIGNVSNALNTNDLVSLGKAMSQNQEYLEKIRVSNEKLRSMINTAKITAYGAKITGAGNGGCIIALTDESNRQQTIDNLGNKGYECFSVKIDSNGIRF